MTRAAFLLLYVILTLWVWISCGKEPSKSMPKHPAKAAVCYCPDDNEED